jgi:sialate O-acetylesterase
MHIALRALAVFCCASFCFAQDGALSLHALFSDHMVLPRGETVRVKGTARAGDEATLSAAWLKESVRAIAGPDGAFELPLPSPEGQGPFRFEVTSGGKSIAVNDVLVGDVWLASGQSNMEMSVGPSPTGPRGCDDWQRECATAAIPQLRLFTVRRHVSVREESDVVGQWSVSTPESAVAFSATAFFFARDLALRGHGPIGIVASSWGGTVCEAWTRTEGLIDFPEFGPALERVREQATDATAPSAMREQFFGAVERSAVVDPLAGGGATVTLPHVWSKHGLAAHDGVGVYSRTVEVSPDWVGKDLAVHLGPIDDMDVVLWNGQRIGGTYEMGRWADARHLRVPGAMVKAGTARIVVAVVDASGEGGIGGSAEACRIQAVDGGLGSVSLAEGWSFQKGPSLRELPRLPDAGQQNPNVPTVLWNGMIAPLAPFPFAGAIWYQGESNRDRAQQYAKLFPSMIRDWRAAFGKEFAFVFVQIAPFGYRDDRGQTFALRIAQEAALALPRVGMAVTTDIGDPKDIHPTQKRLVGERLAAEARRIQYGELGGSSLPPRATKAKVAGADVVLAFDHATSWRTTEQGPRHFELAGDDGVFHAAAARIDGAGIRLSCSATAKPVSVRYASAADAMANLWNEHGLPLPPFGLRIDG